MITCILKLNLKVNMKNISTLKDFIVLQSSVYQTLSYQESVFSQDDSDCINSQWYTESSKISSLKKQSSTASIFEIIE